MIRSFIHKFLQTNLVKLLVSKIILVWFNWLNLTIWKEWRLCFTVTESLLCLRLPLPFAFNIHDILLTSEKCCYPANEFETSSLHKITFTVEFSSWLDLKQQVKLFQSSSIQYIIMYFDTRNSVICKVSLIYYLVFVKLLKDSIKKYIIWILWKQPLLVKETLSF